MQYLAVASGTLPILVNVVSGPISKDTSHPSKCSIRPYYQGQVYCLAPYTVLLGPTMNHVHGQRPGSRCALICH